jgi:hypothetical protein
MLTGSLDHSPQADTVKTIKMDITLDRKAGRLFIM